MKWLMEEPEDKLSKVRNKTLTEHFFEALTKPCLFICSDEVALATMTPKEEKHIHFHMHGVNGEHIEMVKIQQELDELEEKKRELKRRMGGYE